MYGKLYLLAVVCISFVQANRWFEVRSDEHLEDSYEDFDMVVKPKGNHFSEILKGPSTIIDVNNTPKKLEDVIEEAVSVADDIFRVGVNMSEKQWKALNDIRRIIVSNSTEYTSKAEWVIGWAEETLSSMSANIKTEMGNSYVTECVDEERKRARNHIQDLKKTFVAQIWRLNFDYNSTCPEFPFILIEETLRSDHKAAVESIKECNDTKSVEGEVGKYAEKMNGRYNSFMEATTAANDFLFRHQLKVYKKYREMNEKIKKLYLVSFGDMRKCLDDVEEVQQQNGPHTVVNRTQTETR